MANSDFWRNLADQFLALQDRLRAGGATTFIYKELKVLAGRGARELPVVTASEIAPDLLAVWLDASKEERLASQSSSQSNEVLSTKDEVLSEEDYAQKMIKGTLDRLCQASAIFCKGLEDNAVQAEFEEKQRNKPAKTDSDAWIRRADELLGKHPSANYHRASELYQFATSMLSTLYGVESPEMRSLRSNAKSASKDKSAFQAGHISLLSQGAIKAARDDLKAGLTGSLKSAPEIVPISRIKGAVTGALLSRYRSEIKRAILTQLALNPKATDGEICRGLDADGSVELPSSWKSKVSDRGFFDAYSDAARRHKVEVNISKVRKDLRKLGLLE